MSIETQVAPDAATQIQASEVAETPEVAIPEPETTDQPEEAQDKQEDPAERTRKRLERRIDRVSAARYQAEARAQQIQQEAEQLRQRLQQFEQGETPQAQQPDPVALANEIATIREVNKRGDSIAKDGQKRFEGFDKAVAVVIEEAGPLFRPIAPNAPIGRPTPLGEAVLDADDPAAVLHHLGNNPDLAEELGGLTATQIARRIAKIEMDLSKAKEPKTSTAPKALSPVKPVARDDGALSDNLPIEEWTKRFHKSRRNG